MNMKKYYLEVGKNPDHYMPQTYLIKLDQSF